MSIQFYTQCSFLCRYLQCWSDVLILLTFSSCLILDGTCKLSQLLSAFLMYEWICTTVYHFFSRNNNAINISEITFGEKKGHKIAVPRTVDMCRTYFWRKTRITHRLSDVDGTTRVRHRILLAGPCRTAWIVCRPVIFSISIPIVIKAALTSCEN